MCGFEQACGNVCDIAKGIQISLTIDIPMPGMHKPTRLGGEPCSIESVKDFRSTNNGTGDRQEKDTCDKNNKDDMSFLKPGDKPEEEDEEKKNERWH